MDVKVVILGNSNVGKTCLTKRYVEGSFSPITKNTIAAAFMTKRVVVDGVPIRLQLWDSAGAERFRSMAPMYYRGAGAAVLVFDITNDESFLAVQEWVKELKANVVDDIVIVIAGNKVDLDHERKVASDMAQRYADAIGASYHETSAKNNTGVDSVFTDISYQVAKAGPKTSPPSASASSQHDVDIHPDAGGSSPRKRCCA